MSNPLKKAKKGIKKQFKRVVKVAKKIVKSDIFKVVVIATAIYFTAGVAAGFMGAPAAAAAGSTASTAAATAGSAAITTAVPTAVLAGGGAPVASTGIWGTATALGAKAAALPAFQQTMLANGLAGAGGMLKDAAAAEKKKSDEKKARKRSETQLDIYGMQAEAERRAGVVQTDDEGRTEYDSEPAQPPSQSPIQNVANVEQQPTSYYNSSTDAWAPVQNIAQQQSQA